MALRSSCELDFHLILITPDDAPKLGISAGIYVSAITVLKPNVPTAAIVVPDNAVVARQQPVTASVSVEKGMVGKQVNNENKVVGKISS